MNARFLIFISIVTAVLGLSSFYVGERVLAHFVWAAEHPVAVWLTLGFFIVLQLLGPFLYRTVPDRRNRLLPLHGFVYLTLGTFACLFFYALASDIALLAWKVLFGFDAASVLERRAGAAVAVLTIGTVLVGAFQARGSRVYEVDVPIEGLPAALEGFRIVQISDLHVGPTIGRAYAEKAVAKANALAPDVVALTGDLIDGTIEKLRDGIEPLRRLQAAHGVFYVTGNHEYYWGALEWIEEFRRLGARPLLNEHCVIRKEGAAVVIAGVTDEGAGSIIASHASDPAKAVAGASPNAVKILLAHRPSQYKKAASAGFDLQLSGHTHGGQFFPWSLVVGLAYRFTKGLHRFERLWVYVSRGTGYWGPPVRFGVPGEVTLLRLKRSIQKL